jgi:hypothetical protein
MNPTKKNRWCSNGMADEVKNRWCSNGMADEVKNRWCSNGIADEVSIFLFLEPFIIIMVINKSR